MLGEDVLAEGTGEQKVGHECEPEAVSIHEETWELCSGI